METPKRHCQWFLIESGKPIPASLRPLDILQNGTLIWASNVIARGADILDPHKQLDRTLTQPTELAMPPARRTYRNAGSYVCAT